MRRARPDGGAAVRALLRRAPGRDLPVPRPDARPRARRGRVPGDVPARAPRATPTLRPRRPSARVGLHDRHAGRARRAPPRRSRCRSSFRSCRRPTRGRPTRSSRISPTTSRARSGPPSSSGTATTSPTQTSPRRSARARTRPARPRPPESAACAGREQHHDRPHRARRALPRGRGRRSACSTSRTTSTDSPIGPLLVAATERGSLQDLVLAPSRRRSSTRSPARYGARVLRSPRPVDGVRRELDEYFDGRRREPSTSRST